MDTRTVQDWLGQSSITQTQRYTNLLPSQKQEQIQKLVIKIEKPCDAPRKKSREMETPELLPLFARVWHVYGTLAK